MFGEKGIYGQSVAKVGPKGRIILPTYTKVEKREELVLMKYRSFYKVVSRSYLEELVEDIELDIEESFRKGKDDIEDLMSYRDYICMSIIKMMKVDAQMRINPGTLFPESSEVRIVGVGNGVYLFPDGEFEKYEQRVMKQDLNL